MNDQERAACGRQMKWILQQLYAELSLSCRITIEEMIEAAETPYSKSNEFGEWQPNSSVDRYPTTAVGNLCEVLVIATLVSLGVDPRDIEVCSDNHTQVKSNIDITVRNLGTFQVKQARRGSPPWRQLFVYTADIKGSPDFVVYVDREHHLLHVIECHEFRMAEQVLKVNEEPSGLELDHRTRAGKEEKGYFVLDPVRLLVELPVPAWAIASDLNTESVTK